MQTFVGIFQVVALLSAVNQAASKVESLLSELIGNRGCYEYQIVWFTEDIFIRFISV